MRVGTNECVGVGGCWGVLLLHIVCGFACIAFMQALLSRISLIMIFTAPCLNVVPGVHIACCGYFSNGIKNKLASKTFNLFSIEYGVHTASCARVSLAVPEGSDVTGPSQSGGF